MISVDSNLFPILQLLAVEAVEQQGEEEVEYHEVAHDQRGQEDKEAGLRTGHLLGSHAVPQGLDPLPA